MKPQTTLNAEKKVKEILGAIHYDHNSLTHALIKAYRGGMNRGSITQVRILLNKALDESFQAVEIAIAQPEQSAAIRPVVEL